jgi:hypothetical protein
MRRISRLLRKSILDGSVGGRWSYRRCNIGRRDRHTAPTSPGRRTLRGGRRRPHRHLDELAREGEQAWLRVNALIDTKKIREYDTAVVPLRDLRDLNQRDGDPTPSTNNCTYAPAIRRPTGLAPTPRPRRVHRSHPPVARALPRPAAAKPAWLRGGPAVPGWRCWQVQRGVCGRDAAPFCDRCFDDRIAASTGPPRRACPTRHPRVAILDADPSMVLDLVTVRADTEMARHYLTVPARASCRSTTTKTATPTPTRSSAASSRSSRLAR